MRQLPFPGYSWPFTQHAVGLDPETLYGFLACASYAEGSTNPGPQITSLMIEKGLLTPNVRNGRADAWRDYQQILAELGLIYSTRVKPELNLTRAGTMLLAGEIGFSELMTLQALRYQYPNGQKTDLQSRLRERLQDELPENLIDLYVSSGVLIKPAILILRALLELKKQNKETYLSVDECQNFLLPIKRNSDWQDAINDILTFRANPTDISHVNRHARRNIQDWFKFLEKTDIFQLENARLALSGYANSVFEVLEKICIDAEDNSKFWVPVTGDRQDRIKWFDYYGDIPFDVQEVLPHQEIKPGYIQENYVGGTNEDILPDFRNEVPTLNLLDQIQRGVNTSNSNLNNPDTILRNFKEGLIRRRTQTIYHQRIVDELAQHFRGQGAQVFEDPDSVDLLVKWDEGLEAIIEVKTVTRRSLQSRIRLALGQLEEYGYRHLKNSGAIPDKVMVLSLSIPKNAWQVDFLTDYSNTGLICRDTDKYESFSQKNSKTFKFWSSVAIQNP